MKKIKLIFGVAGLLGVFSMICLLISSNIMPSLHIPNPAMPEQNAFDRFVKAGDLLQDEKVIKRITAAQLKGEGKDPLPENTDALISKNEKAISLVQEGLAYPYLNPPIRSVKTELPYYAKFREISRLMNLKGRCEARRGDYDSALQSWLDGMQMGAMIPRGSCIIGMLVGFACEAVSRRPMWRENVEILGVAQTRKAIARLEAIQAQRVSYAETLQQEKWTLQASLMEIFDRAETFKDEDEAKSKKSDGKKTSNNEPNEKDERMMYGVLWTIIGKGRVLNNVTSYMDQLTENARKPYALHLPTPKLPFDPISRILLPVFDQTQVRAVNSETQTLLLLVTLALHAYHEEKHTYPALLEELVPAYLKKLPNDPFALRGTFQYRNKGDGFLLYSVGPDSKDDGGKPIDDPTKAKKSNPQLRYYVEAESKGDVVVGVNTY